MYRSKLFIINIVISISLICILFLLYNIGLSQYLFSVGSEIANKQAQNLLSSNISTYAFKYGSNFFYWQNMRINLISKNEIYRIIYFDYCSINAIDFRKSFGYFRELGEEILDINLFKLKPGNALLIQNSNDGKKVLFFSNYINLNKNKLCLW